MHKNISAKNKSVKNNAEFLIGGATWHKFVKDLRKNFDVGGEISERDDKRRVRCAFVLSLVAAFFLRG